MKARAFILILLFLFPIFAGVGAATNEGYGEDQTSLGQTVDTFDTSDNISIAVDVIRNSTLEVIELNYTPAPPSLNISDFVETDPANRYSQTDDVSTWEGIRRGDASSRLVGDLGANYFGDSFSLYFELNITDAEAGDASWRTYCLLFGLMNHATNYDDQRRIAIWANQRQADPANDAVYEIFMQIRTTGGAQDSDTSISVAVGTNYFINLTRHNSGDDVRLTIRTGSYVGALHDTLDTSIGTFGGEFLRYIFTPAMKLNVNDPNDESSGTVSRIVEGITGSYDLAGYFTTTNYLDNPNINGSGLALLINSSLPALTDIQIQISNDNASWTDHEGTVGNSVDLLGGFEAIDLRDLNYSVNIYFRGNLSTTDSTVTPRVHQMRLITMIGAGVGIPGIDVNVTGAWEYYNLSAIQVITGTHDHGLVNDTYWVDALTFQCSEVVGVPGYVVKFNITGIDPAAISLWLVNYVWYDGSASHEVNVELWNYTSSAFVEIGEIPDMLALDWQNFTIYPLRIPLEFVNSSGVMVGRFYHADAGNINHDIIFDRISLHAFIPTAAAEESFQFFWIVIAIALMLIGLVLSKMWFDGKDP